MSSDLADAIRKLRRVEERLIQEESVITGIRCEVRNTLTMITEAWDAQARQMMEAQQLLMQAKQNQPEQGGPRRESFIRRSKIKLLKMQR
jgi:hypothetical protein